jgi:hypothetical protein
LGLGRSFAGTNHQLRSSHLLSTSFIESIPSAPWKRFMLCDFESYRLVASVEAQIPVDGSTFSFVAYFYLGESSPFQDKTTAITMTALGHYPVYGTVPSFKIELWTLGGRTGTKLSAAFRAASLLTAKFAFDGTSVNLAGRDNSRFRIR